MTPNEAPGASPMVPASPPAGGEAMSGMMGMMSGMEGMPAAEDRAVAGVAAAIPPDVPRKIVYTADVDLVVEDFAAAAEQVVRLVEQFGGYVAESDLGGTPGVQRHGRWKVRIPVEKFDSFVEGVVTLGELNHRQTDSQDVTEEFYDLEARIKNKTVEEQRLIKHLEETTGKLKDILDVERELSRVREEIERLQGRLRLLANLTSLTTVTINLQERLGYTPVQAPTFGTRIGHRFQASVEQLVRFGEGIVLALVSVVPWLPVWFVVLAATWLIARRLLRRRAAEARPADSGTIQ